MKAEFKHWKRNCDLTARVIDSVILQLASSLRSYWGPFEKTGLVGSHKGEAHPTGKRDQRSGASLRNSRVRNKTPKMQIWILGTVWHKDLPRRDVLTTGKCHTWSSVSDTFTTVSPQLWTSGADSPQAHGSKSSSVGSSWKAEGQALCRPLSFILPVLCHQAHFWVRFRVRSIQSAL